MQRLAKKANGFTLIELLVVIAIVGLLSSVVIYFVNQGRINSRDARRIEDIRTIATALDLYFDDHGSYPLCDESIGGGNPFCGDCDPAVGTTEFTTALQPLVTGKYLLKIPTDPLNKIGCYTYEYYTYNVPDIWSAQCNTTPVGSYYYIIKFSTEGKKDFTLPAWNYQRVTGKEYCFVGFR